MAYTITQQPSLLQPVYNWSYSNVLISSATTSLRYVFDVYITAGTVTTSNYVDRFFLNARPVTLNCEFSPNRILEKYMSYNLFPSITAGSYSTTSGSSIIYQIQCGQELGGVITPNMTAYTGLVFGGVASYEDQPNWNYNSEYAKYVMTAITSNDPVYQPRFLTNAPTTQLMRNDERATLSILNITNWKKIDYSWTPDLISVVAYQNSGGTKTCIFYNRANLSATSLNTYSYINTIPTGIWNLNRVPTGDTLNIFNTVPMVNVDTDYKYEVYITKQQPFTASTSVFSKKITYMIDNTWNKSLPIRLMFLNSFGVFDYFTFTMINRRFVNVNQRETYQKVLSYNYAVGDRGKTTLDTDMNESKTVTSDWVSDETSYWLCKELNASKSVYELKDDGTTLPVMITTQNIEAKQGRNDRLFFVEFEYEYAYPVNTQRG